MRGARAKACVGLPCAVRGRGAAAQLLGPPSGYRCCAGPRGRRAAAGVSPGNTAGLVRALAPPSRACGVDPQSFRSLPRARTRCGSAWFCAAPPISGEQPLGALAAEQAERSRRPPRWPVVREDTPAGCRMNITRHVTCFFWCFYARSQMFWQRLRPRKTDEPHDARVDASSHV